MGASKSAQEEMLGAAQRELQQRRAEESHYQRLVESLEEDLARSEAALAKIKAETQTVVEKSRLVEQQLAQTHEGHEQELKAARENFGILDKEYDGLKEDNATLMIELEKMHSLLADTNRSAAASTETETALHARIQSLVTDIETLKKSISSLRQENSTKDNQIERLQRAREQLKDDKEMLNIALDSKQQEVELVRRDLIVRVKTETDQYSLLSLAPPQVWRRPAIVSHPDRSARRIDIYNTCSQSSRRERPPTHGQSSSFRHKHDHSFT